MTSSNLGEAPPPGFNFGEAPPPGFNFGEAPPPGFNFGEAFFNLGKAFFNLGEAPPPGPPGTPTPALLALIALITWAITHVAVGALRRWAAAHHLLDHPNHRSSHTRPVPRLGGVAIVAVVLGLAPLLWRLLPATALPGVWAWWAAALLLALISWRDDLRPLSPRLRFAVQGLVALLILLIIGPWTTLVLPWLGALPLGWLGLPLTLLWLVGLINAYNFMDGIDGIAASQALIAGVGWLLLGHLTAQPGIALLGLLLAAAALGFLGHNWPPARIFMGDVGSTFLGLTFATLPLLAARQDPRLALAGVLLLWPFLFDTILTFIRRWRAGENLFTPHRRHLYQQLVIFQFGRGSAARGQPHARVTLLYAALAVVGLLLAWAWTRAWPPADWLIALALPALALGLVTYARHTSTR
jgi:UDP-N-acetylmuramyl pentapeptide phosphotransferase/UDP-N-acetylglucosamine-1-phosphate transferase